MMYYDPTGYREEEIEVREDMSAIELLNAIIKAKNIWEENQKIIDETSKKHSIFLIEVILNANKINEAIEKQDYAHKQAKKAREFILKTESFECNNRFKEEYTKYYDSSLEDGGRMEEVIRLRDILIYDHEINPNNFKEPRNQILTPSPQLIEFKKDYEGFSLTLYDAKVGMEKHLRVILIGR